MSRRVHPWPVNRLGHCSAPLASTPLVIRIILPPLLQVLETRKRLVGEAHDEHPYPSRRSWRAHEHESRTAISVAGILAQRNLKKADHTPEAADGQYRLR